MSYGNIDLGQHWLSNGLLPDGTKPLPEPMLTCHQRCFGAFTGEQCHEKDSWIIHNMCSEIILLKLLRHVQGTNELILKWETEMYVCHKSNFHFEKITLFMKLHKAWFLSYNYMFQLFIFLTPVLPELNSVSMATYVRFLFHARCADPKTMIYLRHTRCRLA